MIIYLCLSGHGFGHAARQASIFRNLHLIKPHWQLVVSSSLEEKFLNLFFKDLPITYRSIKWDIGTIQNNALSFDFDSTLIELKKLHLNLDKSVQDESLWLKEKHQEVLILADIPPSAALLAKSINAPLILIGNFGWDDIYRNIGEEFKEYTLSASDLYKQANFLIRCPFSSPMKWSLKQISIGLTTSEPYKLPESFISKINSIRKKKICISFGGLGYKFDSSLFSKWSKFLFLIPSDGIKLESNLSPIENILYIPNNYRLLDVMPYCDRIITKPGYSTLCQALTLKKGVHFVERSSFSEAELLTNGLIKYGQYRLISTKDFEDGNWQLDQPLKFSSKNRLSNNGAYQAAIEIIKYKESVS